MKRIHLLPSLAACVLLAACSGTFLSQPSSTESGSVMSEGSSSSEVSASSESSSSQSSDQETISAFYAAIENHEFETAYNMYATKKVSLATFRGWYENVTTATVTNVQEVEDNIFTFTVALQEDTGETGTYNVRMRVENGTVDTLSSEQVEAGSNSWVRYNDDKGVLSIELPAHWKEISGYDGSFYDFERINLTAMGGYGDEDNSALFEYHTEENTNRQGGTWMDFAESSIVSDAYYTLASTENGPHWKKYRFNEREKPRYTILYEFEDGILSISFLPDNEIGDRIANSVRIVR